MKTKKQQIKQKIIATIVVTFMFVMTFGSVNIKSVGAADIANTIMELVVSSGSLSVASVAQINFNTFTINGTSTNTLANLTQVNMVDARGSGAGWNVIGSVNDMAAGTNIISNAFFSWSPGTIYALGGASNTGVTAGASYSGNFGDGTRTLASATSNNGMGNYVINGTAVNVLVLSSVAAGTYHNTLTLTIA